MSILARLVPSFDGPRRPSPYFYIPPKQRWWPFLTAFAAGGISVLVLFGPSTQSDADANRKTIVSRVQKPRIEPAPNTSKPSKAPAQLMTAERSDAAKGSSVAATTADATPAPSPTQTVSTDDVKPVPRARPEMETPRQTAETPRQNVVVANEETIAHAAVPPAATIVPDEPKGTASAPSQARKEQSRRLSARADSGARRSAKARPPTQSPAESNEYDRGWQPDLAAEQRTYAFVEPGAKRERARRDARPPVADRNESWRTAQAPQLFESAPGAEPWGGQDRSGERQSTLFQDSSWPAPTAAATQPAPPTDSVDAPRSSTSSRRTMAGSAYEPSQRRVRSGRALPDRQRGWQPPEPMMRRAEEPRSYNSDREYWDRVARTGERDQYRRSTENRGDREGPWGMRWDERDRDGAARDTGRSSSRRTTNNRGRGDTQWGPGSGQDGWRGGRAFGGLFGDQ